MVQIVTTIITNCCNEQLLMTLCLGSHLLLILLQRLAMGVVEAAKGLTVSHQNWILCMRWLPLLTLAVPQSSPQWAEC